MSNIMRIEVVEDSVFYWMTNIEVNLKASTFRKYCKQ